MATETKNLSLDDLLENIKEDVIVSVIHSPPNLSQLSVGNKSEAIYEEKVYVETKRGGFHSIDRAPESGLKTSR